MPIFILIISIALSVFWHKKDFEMPGHGTVGAPGHVFNVYTTIFYTIVIFVVLSILFKALGIYDLPLR
jgi:uncharacterized membrane protein